jgi:hypothetical protein
VAVKLKLADDLALPADEAVTQKYGFIGRSGSGKSYAAMKLAELFLENGAQIIALDWVGIWWSLRLAADGKRPGFEHVYIFGGEHADVDLRPESGALMADLVVDKHISVVLDVMHFRKAERTRFATAFAEQFFHRKKTARTACHLFIEEAQAYLPQMVRGDEARMVGVFEDIGKVGRNYGIGNSLISQRPQAINKDVLNQVEVLLAFQTNGPQERKAIAGWTAENTDAGAALVQELPKLDIGHAQVWSPQWLRVARQVHISQRVTYDASSTPKGIAKTIRPTALGKADLEQLGEQIAATIEKAKADDPRELRKQVADLKKELASKVPLPASKETMLAPKVVEKFVLKDGQIDKAEKLIARAESVIGIYLDRCEKVAESIKGAIDPIVEALGHAATGIESAIESTRNTQATTEQRVVNHRQAPVMSTHGRRVAPVAATNRPAPVVSPDGVSKAEQRILDAVAWWKAANIDSPTRHQVAFVAGYTVNGHFNNMVGSLRTKGLVDYPQGGGVSLTDAGEQAANPPEVVQTREGLIEAVTAVLKGESPRRIFKAVVDAGRDLTRDELAELTNYTVNGHFNNMVASLRSLGVIDYPRQGGVRLADMFESLD